MSEREESPTSGGSPPASGTSDRPTDWRHQTTPGIEPVHGSRSEAAPTGSGAHGSTGTGEDSHTAPEYSTEPVAVRRADALAGLLLLLAGAAAGLSLLLRWIRDRDLTGWELVRRGFDDLEQGIGELFASGFWQPLAVVLGGGALFVLGLLMFLPARKHRFLGILAFLVSLVALAGVLVPLAQAGWDVSVVGVGFWFAVAVPALGLLGALKAMLTGPRYTSRPPST